MSKDKDQRRRLAAFRAIAPLAVPPLPVSNHQQHPVEEEAGDTANPSENLPQVSRASHYS